MYVFLKETAWLCLFLSFSSCIFTITQYFNHGSHIFILSVNTWASMNNAAMKMRVRISVEAPASIFWVLYVEHRSFSFPLHSFIDFLRTEIAFYCSTLAWGYVRPSLLCIVQRSHTDPSFLICFQHLPASGLVSPCWFSRFGNIPREATD